MKTRIQTITALLLFCTLTIVSLSAKAAGKEATKPDTINLTAAIDSIALQLTSSAGTDDSLDMFTHALDSMVSALLSQNTLQIDSSSYTDSLELFIVDGYDISSDSLQNSSAIPDSVFIERLQNLSSLIDLPYNETVRNIIKLYTERRRNVVEVMLGLSSYYFPLFEETLDKYNLPVELKYMAIIESALNPKAISRAGACGLWQFMYSTGKRLGLEINSYVDERRDPIKATDAAARYLKTLYDIYGDWHLVIAAYNCGPGNVNKAISRSGGVKDYWSVYYRLPRETRTYVPAFIAASYVMNYYKCHNLTPRKVNFPIVTDTLMVSSYINLKQISEYMKIDLNTLRELNPMYRVDIIPAKADKPYPLCLPQENIMGFISNQDSILAYNRETYFPNNTIKAPSQATVHYTPADIKGKDKVVYTVKSGDNIGFISQWFHVSASDLRYWNNINRNMIRAGQKLVIYVPSGKGSYYKAFDSTSLEQKNSSIGKKATASAVQNTTTSDNSNLATESNISTGNSDVIYYTVKKGDNLWDIAKKYPGVSAENIKNWNNIRNPKDLYIGQKLKILHKG